MGGRHVYSSILDGDHYTTQPVVLTLLKDVALEVERLRQFLKEAGRVGVSRRHTEVDRLEKRLFSIGSFNNITGRKMAAGFSGLFYQFVYDRPAAANGKPQ